MAVESNSTASARPSKVSESAPLGRKDYHRYINSEAWRAKRWAFLTSKLPKDCYVCSAKYRKGFHVHHRTYKRLGCERIAVDLVCVCPPCHDYIHRIHKDKIPDLWKATKKARNFHRRRERAKAREQRAA